jgi:hypothetical protein
MIKLVFGIQYFFKSPTLVPVGDSLPVTTWREHGDTFMDRTLAQIERVTHRYPDKGLHGEDFTPIESPERRNIP